MGFISWKQNIAPNGANLSPAYAEAVDPSGNKYSVDKWVLLVGGWWADTVGGAQSYINTTSNTWYVKLWSPSIRNPPGDNYVNILAIPKEYFQKVYN